MLGVGASDGQIPFAEPPPQPCYWGPGARWGSRAGLPGAPGGLLSPVPAGDAQIPVAESPSLAGCPWPWHGTGGGGGRVKLIFILLDAP